MRIIDAVVLIEKTSQMYARDLAIVEYAGMTNIFDMFEEVFLMHDLANKLVEDTFKFRLGNEVCDTFTEQSADLLDNPSGENNFKNFAIAMNERMGEEIPQEIRLAAVVDLITLNVKMIKKMLVVEHAGVNMRDLFSDDYVYICAKELCGFDIIEKYTEYLSNPNMSELNLFDDLVELANTSSEG